MSKLFGGVSTDSALLGSAAGLDDIGGSPGSRSVCAWVYLTSYGASSFGRIWVKAPNTNLAGWAMWVGNGDGSSAPSNSFNGFVFASAGGVSARAYAINGTLALNKWWFLAMTYTGSDGGPRLFAGDTAVPVAECTYSAITGFDRVDISGTAYASDASENAYIGNRADGTRNFGGRIAHVSVWDNKLTLAHLERLRQMPWANRHAFTTGGTAINLKGYWPMDEQTAATMLDHTGNGNTGTVTGTTVAEEPPMTQSMFAPLEVIEDQASVPPPPIASPPMGLFTTVLGGV